MNGPPSAPTTWMYEATGGTGGTANGSPGSPPSDGNVPGTPKAKFGSFWMLFRYASTCARVGVAPRPGPVVTSSSSCGLKCNPGAVTLTPLSFVRGTVMPLKLNCTELLPEGTDR